MKFDWNDDKNELLKATRGISFEEVVEAISNDKLLDVLAGTEKYPHQRRFVLNIKNYACIAPFYYDEDSDTCHLITIMRDRKFKYLIEKNHEQ